jgi:predicted YcjX-like family ATPase
MNLREQVLNDLAQDMQASMDFDVLANVLTSVGWTRLEIRYHSNQTWLEMYNWADDVFVDEFLEHKGHWLIENPADATAFALKWQCR